MKQKIGVFFTLWLMCTAGFSACPIDKCNFWQSCSEYNKLVCGNTGTFCRAGSFSRCEGYCQCKQDCRGLSSFHCHVANRVH